MDQQKQIEVIVSPGGESRHILDEENAELYKPFGEVTGTYRNSHVDPTWDLLPPAIDWLIANHALLRQNDEALEAIAIDAKHCGGEVAGRETAKACLPRAAWWADMTVIGGPVLGPFDTRTDALHAEIAWLKTHNLPRPK